MKYLIWLSHECETLREITESLKKANQEIALLLVQDGTYLLDKGCPHSAELKDLAVKVYALKDHIEERGISDRLVIPAELVDYSGMVDLIMEQYDKVITA